MPRFAILTHDQPFLHWDFLLEHGGSCRTWRLSQPPLTSDRIVAEALPDHRLVYLDYEGPVSGDRGVVSQWDAGLFDWQSETPTEVAIQLRGRKLSGLVRMTATTDGNWEWSISDLESVRPQNAPAPVV
ncbi:MAG: hypothetical protein JSS49_17050 [Planctomycetes bacterium]|nr:hypothetical protein [Planctomycetota bacterium]